MSEQRHLREKVRGLIRAGKLPDRAPDHMWGGPGTGARCVVCGASTTRDEMEVELEYELDGGERSDSHVVHTRCYSILEEERLGRASEPLRSPTRSPAAASRSDRSSS